MARQGQGTCVRVEQVRKQIDRWRAKKGRRGTPMPSGLWDEASRLARELGVYRVKRALGLNYESLKRRAAEVATGGRAPVPAPRFVELSGGSLLGPTHGVLVELADGEGGRHLTIRLVTGSELDVAGLVEAFGRRRA